MRRHLSVENLYQDEHAMTSSSSEDDHLARVSDLKSFFENLNTTSGTTSEPPSSLSLLSLLQYAIPSFTSFMYIHTIK